MLVFERVALLFVVFGLIGGIEVADKKSCESSFQSKQAPVDPGCKDICINECHGTCNTDGSCTCSTGFENVPNFYYQCRQVCPAIEHPENSAVCSTRCRKHNGCEFGRCDNLGRCICNKGYENHKQNPYLCDPVCEPKCRNGHCEPSSLQCVCRPGYQIIAPYGNCGKLCTPSGGCANGVCAANGVCQCNAGYENDGTNVCVASKSTTTPLVANPATLLESRCERGEVTVNGVCEKACGADRDCLPGKPRCSPTGYCTTKEDDSGGSTSAVLGDERNWVIVAGVTITVLVVLLAIVLGVVSRVRHGRRSSGSTRMTMSDISRELIENATGDTRKDRDNSWGRKNTSEPPTSANRENVLERPLDEAWRAQSKGSKRSETPKSETVVEEQARYSTAQFANKEAVARVNPNMFGHLDSPANQPEDASYMRMHDLSFGVEEDPIYANAPHEQDDSIYENFQRAKY